VAYAAQHSKWSAVRLGLGTTALVVMLMGASALPLGAAPLAEGTAAVGGIRTTRDDGVVSAVKGTGAPMSADQLNAARPYPLAERTANEPDGGVIQESATGAPVAIPGALPASNWLTVGSYDAPVIAALDMPVPDSTYPFARWRWFGRYRTYPVSTIGKLFFTQGGANYWCSAATVGASEIWTAGHCVHAGDNNPNSWSTNFLFCPSFDESQGGINPAVGCWTSDGNATVAADWYAAGDPGRDIAAVHLNPTGTSAQARVDEVTGRVGFAYNYPRNQMYMAFGYSAHAVFSGGKILTVAANFASTRAAGDSVAAQTIGGDLGPGSDGGPWLMNFGGGNYLNGQTAWRTAGHSLEVSSPYFDDLANQIRLSQGV
jgi:hypothetical protein